jgi:hypothetical protein
MNLMGMAVSPSLIRVPQLNSEIRDSAETELAPWATVRIRMDRKKKTVILYCDFH